MKNTHWLTTGLTILTMLAFGLVGCQNFDNNAVTTPDLGAQPDFIVGDAEIDDWGGQYGDGNSYFMLNIPVTGAMQIAYTLQGGGSYNLFGIAGAAVKQEIGLKDGDLLDSVCVSYDGSDAFSAMPANAQESRKGNFLQYQRLNDDGSVSEWWSNTAGFAFSGDITTVCTVSAGVVQGTEVDGPFDKPVPAAPAALAVTYPCDGNTYGYRMATADYVGSGIDIVGAGKSGNYSGPPYPFSGTSVIVYNSSGTSMQVCLERIGYGSVGTASIPNLATARWSSGLYVYW